MMLYLEPLDGGMVHALEISPQRAGEDVVHTGADLLDYSLRPLTASWRHLAHDQHRRLSEAPAPSPDEKRHDYYPYILYYLIIIHQEHCVTNAALCWQTSSTTAFLNLYVIPHISNRKRSNSLHLLSESSSLEICLKKAAERERVFLFTLFFFAETSVNTFESLCVNDDSGVCDTLCNVLPHYPQEHSSASSAFILH